MDTKWWGMDFRPCPLGLLRQASLRSYAKCDSLKPITFTARAFFKPLWLPDPQTRPAETLEPTGHQGFFVCGYLNAPVDFDVVGPFRNCFGVT